MKRQAMILCCVGLCAAASMGETVIKSVDAQGPPAGKKWRLVWSDEFDGTAIDMQRW